MSTRIIYKYPKIIDLCKSFGHRIDNIYSDDFFEEYNPEVLNQSGFYYRLSKHPSNKAIDIMTNNKHIIYVAGLVQNTNPNIGPLLEYVHSRNIIYSSYWEMMSKNRNPTVLDFLTNNSHYIDWDALSENDSNKALDILENNVSKINWPNLSLNSNPRAIILIENNISKIRLDWLASNPSAINLISREMGDSWYYFGEGFSRNPNAMDILIKNPHLIVFDSLLTNPSAMSYLEDKLKHIQNTIGFSVSILERLAENPNSLALFDKMFKEDSLEEEYEDIIIHVIKQIYETHFYYGKTGYELDYQAMSIERTKLLEPELMAVFYEPSLYKQQLDHHLDNGGDFADFCFDIDFIYKP